MMNPISRRKVLAGAAGTAAVLAAPAVLAQGARQSLSFAFAEDESGAIQSLIDGFNEAQSAVEVSWTKAPEETDAFFRLIMSDLEAGSDEIDLFGADVIWTSELASAGLIRDLSARIYAELPTQDMLGAALNSASYRSRLYAVPWYTDAGMLFYRRDLLEEAGLEPPGTWDELASAVEAVRQNNDVEHGFVFQGGRYEGGVTNALEFIWSAGGRAWTPQSQVTGTFGMRAVHDGNGIVLNSRNAARGLAKARELVENGIAPEDVATFNERDALRVFAAGDAVFMRNWPFAYGLIGSEEFSGISTEQVGIARIPTLNAGDRSYSCLGGWNLAVSNATANPDAAWQFIRYAVEPEQQRLMAEQGGYLPVLTELYDDEEISSAVPVLRLGAEAVRSARARPASTIYSRLAPRLAIMFNRILVGEIDPTAAVLQTEAELQRIVDRG